MRRRNEKNQTTMKTIIMTARLTKNQIRNRMKEQKTPKTMPTTRNPLQVQLKIVKRRRRNLLRA